MDALDNRVACYRVDHTLMEEMNQGDDLDDPINFLISIEEEAEDAYEVTDTTLTKTQFIRYYVNQII